jgi:hypothetical protein
MLLKARARKRRCMESYIVLQRRKRRSLENFMSQLLIRAYPSGNEQITPLFGHLPSSFRDTFPQHVLIEVLLLITVNLEYASLRDSKVDTAAASCLCEDMIVLMYIIVEYNIKLTVLTILRIIPSIFSYLEHPRYFFYASVTSRKTKENEEARTHLFPSLLLPP